MDFASSDDNTPDASPNAWLESPVSAIERLKVIAERGFIDMEADPEDIAELVRPFLINPDRDAVHVFTIMGACQAALLAKGLSNVRTPFMRVLSNLFGRWAKASIMNSAPGFMGHIQKLEQVLKNDLRPRSVGLKFKPIQYLTEPVGYGVQQFYLYRIVAQLLIDSNYDDYLARVSVDAEISISNGEVTIEKILPEAGFVAVTSRGSAAMQKTHQNSTTSKESIAAGLSKYGVNISSSKERTLGRQDSTQITLVDESVLSGAEQFLIARKFGGNASWETRAGRGAVDLANADYLMEVLVPVSAEEVEIVVGVTARWHRSGDSKFKSTKILSLPRPDK